MLRIISLGKKKVVPKKINDSRFIYSAIGPVAFFTRIYLVYCQDYYICLFTLHTVCSFFPSFSIPFYKELTLSKLFSGFLMIRNIIVVLITVIKVNYAWSLLPTKKIDINFVCERFVFK